MESLVVAICLPKDVAKRLATLCYALPDATWQDEYSYFISLFPLGQINNVRLDKVREVLREIISEPISIELKGVNYSSHGHSSGILQVGVEDSPVLLALQKRLFILLGELGIRPAKSELKAHILLGSVPIKSFSRLGDYLSNASNFMHPKFFVTSIHLLSVHTTSKRTVFDIVEVFHLNK
ncbi:MAG: hypothetical protein Q8K75_06630 [Chlamydiales bacterium]|nr:hypothetical protein [Chlamydiales bacterium]